MATGDATPGAENGANGGNGNAIRLTFGNTLMQWLKAGGFAAIACYLIYDKVQQNGVLTATTAQQTLTAAQQAETLENLAETAEEQQEMGEQLAVTAQTTVETLQSLNVTQTKQVEISEDILKSQERAEGDTRRAADEQAKTTVIHGQMLEVLKQNNDGEEEHTRMLRQLLDEHKEFHELLKMRP